MPRYRVKYIARPYSAHGIGSWREWIVDAKDEIEARSNAIDAMHADKFELSGEPGCVVEKVSEISDATFLKVQALGDQYR